MPRKVTTAMFRTLLSAPFACGLTALLIFGFSVSNLSASENYWVAVDHPNASDSNNGLSLDQPFKTLSRAVQALRPGDTLFIKAGIYREALVLGQIGHGEQPNRDPGLPG